MIWRARALLLALPVAFIVCCTGGLDNPFDLKSDNYVSDTTLVRIMQKYDSLFIDTSIVYDTTVHVDTIVFDTFRIVNRIHYDTTHVLDTTIDTVDYKDTTFYIDTVIHYDSIGYIDTLRIKDTLHFQDTTLYYDTLLHLDTSFFIDTVIHYDSIGYIDTLRVKDTLHFKDTITFKDTVTEYDTIIHKDTLIFKDTTHFLDTVIFRDTLYHYDTLIHRDTIIDTIRFYRTQPFVYLVNLPDSSVFNTFNYGATYSLAVKAAGINPAIIQSYSLKPETGWVWNPIASPWLETFNTTSAIYYTLRVTTDSGSFANSYVLRCDAASVIRGSKPTLLQTRIQTYTGDPEQFDRTFPGEAHVCTLWTDSLPFTPYPERIDYVNIRMLWGLPGCNKYDIYMNRNATYVFDPSRLYDWQGAEREMEHTELPIGTTVLTANCQCVDPDTSQWAGWKSFVFIVRDGR